MIPAAYLEPAEIYTTLHNNYIDTMNNNELLIQTKYSNRFHQLFFRDLHLQDEP